MPVEDANNIKELSNEAMALFQASLATYQELSEHAVERATGARPLDTDEIAKDVTTFWGTVARDLGNVTMVWQQLARIATPPSGEDGADTAS